MKSISLKWIKPPIEKRKLYRYAFNEACYILVKHGIYKSTISAENAIIRKIKKSWIQ